MPDLPTDPRIHEVASELAYPGIVQDRHEDKARILLMRADAADAAAGIRRVPERDTAASAAEGLRSTRSLGDRPALLQHVDRLIARFDD